MAAPATETVNSPLTLTLFGPMRALVAGRPLPRLHSRKSLWLLALLALRAGRPVEREWLAGTLWPDADQDQAFANLRPVLSDLRRALEAEGARLQLPSRHTLCLDLVGADCDVLAFDAATSSGSPSALAKAAALYTRPLLEGCAEEWAPQERRSREEDCLRALQTLADAALAAGDWGAAAGYCRRAVALDPWRDGARRTLMEALWRGGDVNTALQVYREFVTLLRDDPKAVTDAETRALYVRLRAEARRQVSSLPVVASEVLFPAVTGYLPHALTDLVGREDERLEVAAGLRRSRLVTLTGPGGIGKTRLAVEVAGDVAPEFAEGVWLVALEALADEARLEGRIASVLGLKETPGQSWRECLVEHLRRKRLLLVLDNCEHLRTACAQVAAHLLEECARVRVFATSREALGGTGEAVWAVPALAAPNLDHLPPGRAALAHVLAGYDSVQLLVERAQAVQKTFSLTADNAPAVAQICARLEGMPLAIELAAARINVLTVAEIAARLDDHLWLLAGGSRTEPSRQQTLQATLDWSFSLLSDLEQTLLLRLSVFAGGWGLAAAKSVCAGDGLEAAQVLDLTASLVDKSLVVFEPRDAGGRYRFLETVRQYAAEKLARSGMEETVRARHRDWCLGFVQKADVTGPEQEKSLRCLETEHDNLRAALDWCGDEGQGVEAGLRLAGALWPFWYMHGHLNEGRQHLQRALRRDGASAATMARARVLHGANAMASRQGDYASARVLQEESLSITRQFGDRQRIAGALNGLGNVYTYLGEYEEAWALHEESLELSQKTGDKAHAAWSLCCLGSLARSQGDSAGARTLLEESLSLRQTLGVKESIAVSLNNLAGVVCNQGEHALAQTLLGESLVLSQELGDKHLIAWSLNGLGCVAYDQGNPASARTLYGESLTLFRELADLEGIVESLGGLAAVMLTLALPARAARLWGAAEVLRESFSAPMPPNDQ